MSTKFIKTTFNLKFLFLLLFLTCSLQSQSLRKGYPEKTFEKNPIDVIRSNYLNSDGMPSYDVFLKSWNLDKQESVKNIQAYFSVSLNRDFVEIEDNRLIINNNNTIVNYDFYLLTAERYRSENVSLPIWDGRVYLDNDSLFVGGYSSKFNERPIGTIDSYGKFLPWELNDYSKHFPLLQKPSFNVIYDPFIGQLIRIIPAKNESIENKTKSFLPLKIFSKSGAVFNDSRFTINNSKNSELSLSVSVSGKELEIAGCSLQNTEIIDSFPGFRPKLIEGCIQPGGENILTVTVKGEFSEIVEIMNGRIIINEEIKSGVSGDNMSSTVQIDGKFDDWNSIKGVADYEGDFVSYLYPNPDTDILEFKIDNDDQYLYLYSRVAGAHGRTGEKGRYYWYSYIDVDSDPETGYPPTRDDNCYFGIAIGDDCEAQFEFIGNEFVKTFFGFTGNAAEKEVLSGIVELGPSYYSPLDPNGKKREKYKIEYVNYDGRTHITHDYTEGTSEDIIIALSPDGSQVEMKAELKGFMKDLNGEYILSSGKKIDIAVGAEAASDYYNSNAWGADSSPVIYGYTLK